MRILILLSILFISSLALSEWGPRENAVRCSDKRSCTRLLAELICPDLTYSKFISKDYRTVYCIKYLGGSVEPPKPKESCLDDIKKRITQCVKELKKNE